MIFNDLPHYQRVLLLQGPIGPFFWRLANFLRQRGTETFKINFNGGDALFYPALLNRNVFQFRSPVQTWKRYVRTILVSNQIEAIFLLGDCRFYHKVAITIARRLGIAVYVFEEGYVRPDYITLERSGVNGYSSLSRNWAAHGAAAGTNANRAPQPVGAHIIWPTAVYAVLYGFAAMVTHWAYPYYRHHYELFSLGLPLQWVRGWLRKPLYALQQRNLLPLLSGPLSKQYFLVPLQVHKDTQVLVHSHHQRVSRFIRYVITSFASEAPANRHLVFKHHPLNRGFRNYRRLIRDTAQRFGISDRVHYVHDLHLPTLLQHALGTVVINSTVGLSSLLHGAPVKTQGKAIYDLPGLVHQGPLSGFWHAPEPIDQQLHENFRRYLIARTQINGSFYFWGGFQQGRELGFDTASDIRVAPGKWALRRAVPYSWARTQRGAIVVDRRRLQDRRAAGARNALRDRRHEARRAMPVASARLTHTAGTRGTPPP
jgi:capsular polysaccharide export protein